MRAPSQRDTTPTTRTHSTLTIRSNSTDHPWPTHLKHLKDHFAPMWPTHLAPLPPGMHSLRTILHLTRRTSTLSPRQTRFLPTLSYETKFPSFSNNSWPSRINSHRPPRYRTTPLRTNPASIGLAKSTRLSPTQARTRPRQLKLLTNSASTRTYNVEPAYGMSLLANLRVRSRRTT